MFVLSPLQNYPRIELVTVMVIVPLVMNTIMFWVQDQFLKFKLEEYEPLDQIETGEGVNSLPGGYIGRIAGDSSEPIRKVE